MCTWIQNRGSESAGNFNNIITSIKLAILGFIIAISLSLFD